ncbi:MAG: 4-hydroxy-tetrahydrodipicolinate synthase [Bacillota bacterium]|nr:4-hydroxy-tetrahydrodipicolinate synthase [Bacillota bacterium]
MKALPKGMIVPLITPFNEDESIDFEGYRKVIDHVIDKGIHGVLAAGSTGEYHTMTKEEHKSVIKKACEFVGGRVPVMAGISQTTARATIEFAKYAADCGATWGLVLPPYYQPTTRQGVYDFFKEIAENSPVGIVIYNNPLATGVELEPELLYELSLLENIVSVKDTSDQEHTCKVIALTKDVSDFTVITGYEHLMLPTFSVGGDGAFAIIMNLLPGEMVELYQLSVEQNDFAKAAELNRKYAKMYGMMEAEPYPGPVKAAMELIGLPGGPVRKPLTQPSEATRKAFAEELKKIGYSIK